MDNKEAIEELKCLREDYWEDDGYGHETKEYEDTMVALDKAIASLEAWDKIRAEIDNINLNEVATKYEDRFYGFQREVIKIIDKYKADKESD